MLRQRTDRARFSHFMTSGQEMEQVHSYNPAARMRWLPHYNLAIPLGLKTQGEKGQWLLVQQF